MHGRFQIVWVGALMALASSVEGAAQDLIVQVPEITVAAAEQLVNACIEIAAEADSAMAVAVVNPAGELMHFHARQGASPTAPIPLPNRVPPALPR